MALPDLRTLRGPDGEPISLTDLPDDDATAVVQFTTDLVPDRYMGFSVLKTFGPYPPGEKAGMKAFYISMVPDSPEARSIVEAGGGNPKGEIRAYMPMNDLGVAEFEADEEFRANIVEQTFRVAKELIAGTLSKSNGKAE
jgi:hypothetical protein